MKQGARWRLLRLAQRKVTHRLGRLALCGTASNDAGKSTLRKVPAGASRARRGRGMLSRHVEALPDLDDERDRLTVSGTRQRLVGPLQGLHTLWRGAQARSAGRWWP